MESVRGGKNYKELIETIPFGTEFDSCYNDACGVKVTHFNTSPAIASYLYAFCAGPYSKISQEFEIPGRENKIPM